MLIKFNETAIFWIIIVYLFSLLYSAFFWYFYIKNKMLSLFKYFNKNIKNKYFPLYAKLDQKLLSFIDIYFSTLEQNHLGSKQKYQ